jgi:hypothetical protein
VRRRIDERWQREVALQRERRRARREVVRDAITPQAPSPQQDARKVAPEVVRDEITVDRFVLLGLAAAIPLPGEGEVVRDEIAQNLAAWQSLGRSIAVQHA